MGYTLARVPSPVAAKAGGPPRLEAPLPEAAPEFFAKAFRAARKARRPIVIDFWAAWCGPCVRLKHETLEHEAVAKALEQFELIYVDLDEHPELATAYQVKSIPDVILIDADGFIASRLQSFEAPAPFLLRLQSVVDVGTPTPGEEPEQSK